MQAVVSLTTVDFNSRLSMALETRSESGLTWNHLPIELARDSIERDFHSLILPVVRPSWSDRKVLTRIFTDGITNILHGFYLESDKDDIILLRINGEGTEQFLDRRKEIIIMLSLHKAGLTPPVFLEITNGLCYGYIPGRPFTVDDMQVCIYMYIHE